MWVKHTFKVWVDGHSWDDWGIFVTLWSTFLVILTGMMGIIVRNEIASICMWSAFAFFFISMLFSGRFCEWVGKNKPMIVMRVEHERMLKDPFDSMIHAYLETDGGDIEELLDVLRMDSFTLHNQVKNVELKSRVFDAITKMNNKQKIEIIRESK